MLVISVFYVVKKRLQTLASGPCVTFLFFFIMKRVYSKTKCTSSNSQYISLCSEILSANPVCNAIQSPITELKIITISSKLNQDN